MRDDWDKKRGKSDGSVHYPLIRIVSTRCRRGGDWRKKIGGFFVIPFLSSFVISFLMLVCLFLFLLHFFHHHSSLAHSFIHSFIQSSPILPPHQIWCPNKSHKAETQIPKSRKNLAGFQPPHQIGVLIELVGNCGDKCGD